MRKTIKLSVIIPIYNEEKTIADVVNRVLAVELPGLEKEIIISNDGSRDSSATVIAELERQYSDFVKAHTSLINIGKGAAVRLGFEVATGDIFLIQDADLELSPSDYPALLAPILSGETDVVYGSRFLNKSNKIPFRIHFSNWFLTILTNLLYGGHLTDMATNYKVFRREVIQSIQLRSARFEFEPEVTIKLLLAGYQIVEVPISYTPRNIYEGKKIGWIDGIEYVYTLLKYRFFA